MMKPLLLYCYRHGILICLCLIISKATFAQTDADASMIPKNFYCAGAMYSSNSWTNYWEGTFKRDNLNIGKLTTDSYTFIGNYGITNKLDVLFNVPYVTTNASAGTLKGQQGVQDLTVSIKWLAFKQQLGKGSLSLFAIVTGSAALTNYEPDFYPLSIGTHSTTARFRGLLNYKLGHFFATGSGQYIQRGDITLDQNSYYTTQLIYSNKVYMPNMNNYILSTGYHSVHFNFEGIFEQSTTLGGFDIRKNDMPFPSNRMNMTTAGALVKYTFSKTSGLELTAGGNYVLAGRNAGQSTTWYGGVFYLFDFSRKNSK